MKTKLARGLCAAVFAATVASAPVAAQTAGPAAGLTHPLMEPYRNPDGSLMRGLHGEIVNQYWSGYAVNAAPPYTSASATWQVPSVTYDGLSTGGEVAWSWVGIGGYFDSTLIQLGTAQNVSPSGATSYNPWYELYPAGAVGIPYTVKPGDIITASLQCTIACSPSSEQTWQLTMTDETAGWTWTQSFQYQSSMVSAEWILEAPVSNGELPLADYAQATFDPVEANGQDPNLSLSANGIQMSNPWGETSNPSNPVNGNVFSTCWGLAPNYTACTAGSFITPPPPAPTVSLSASPKSITAGQSSTLTWRSTNATSCTGGNFAASGTTGSAVVTPTVTTAYSVTCTGDGGSTTALATVMMSSTQTCHAKKCR